MVRCCSLSSPPRLTPCVKTHSRKRKADVLGRGRCRRRLVLVVELGRDRPYAPSCERPRYK
jgi:hypothetical protein